MNNAIKTGERISFRSNYGFQVRQATVVDARDSEMLLVRVDGDGYDRCIARDRVIVKGAS